MEREMSGNLFAKREKGQSMVELAFILMFLLILLSGIIDIGRMMYEYLSMRDAAQEGAGYAAVYPSYCAEIFNRIEDNLPPTGSYNPIVTIDGISCESAWAGDKSTPLPVHGCEGHEVIVSIDHSSPVSMPFLETFTGPDISMHVEIKDRIVRPSCN